jgi:hypothetical protein
LDIGLGSGNLWVNDWLAKCLVPGVEQLVGFNAILGTQRFLFPGFVVLAPEHISTMEQTEFVSHNPSGYEPAANRIRCVIQKRILNAT